MKFSAVKFSAIALSFAMTAAANAAAYPDKPIRMLVGFAAGGGTDTTARTIGGPLRATLPPTSPRIRCLTATQS